MRIASLLVLGIAACGGGPAPTAAPRREAVAVADAGAEASMPPEAARAHVPALLYPPLACLDLRPNPKAPAMFTPMPCNDARRLRDAYVARVRATGELPRTLHDGATGIDAVGKLVDDFGVQLSARGPAGALVVHVEADGKVRSVISGAFAPTIRRFDAQRMAVEVTLPSSLVPLNWKVTDVFSRDLTIGARFEGLAELGYDELFRGYAALPGGPVDDPAARAAWMRAELPASKGPIVKLPEGALSLYDLDAAVLHSWEPTGPEAERLDLNLSSVVRLGRGAFAFVMPDARQCRGKWFDRAWKDPRPICHARPQHVRGARIVRGTAKKGSTEIIDVDDAGNERVLATLAGTAPASVELVGADDEQLAYVTGKRLVVQDLPSAERPKPRRLDARDSLPCRGGPPAEGGCSIAYARLLDTGAALVETTTAYDRGLYLVTARSWLETPTASLQKRKGAAACTPAAVHHGRETRALVHCGDDTPEWHARTIGRDGVVSDAPAPAAEVELERITREPPASLQLAGEKICAADGLVYRGPVCDGPPASSRKR